MYVSGKKLKITALFIDIILEITKEMCFNLCDGPYFTLKYDRLGSKNEYRRLFQNMISVSGDSLFVLSSGLVNRTVDDCHFPNQKKSTFFTNSLISKLLFVLNGKWFGFCFPSRNTVPTKDDGQLFVSVACKHI